MRLKYLLFTLLMATSQAEAVCTFEQTSYTANIGTISAMTVGEVSTTIGISCPVGTNYYLSPTVNKINVFSTNETLEIKVSDSPTYSNFLTTSDIISGTGNGTTVYHNLYFRVNSLNSDAPDFGKGSTNIYSI